VTVFLTTHNLLEAEKVCDRVAVIRRGLLLAEGSPKEFHGGRSRRVSILGRGFTDALVVRIRDLAAVEGAALESGPQDGEGVGRVLVDLASGADPAPVVRLLVEAGADVTSVESARESLEDIFLKLVEEGEEEGMIE
jgi:ABC-2 type transport system ATP-binding protein